MAVPDVVLADAGHWHQGQMQQIASEGIPVLVPPDAGLHRRPLPGWTGGMYAFMRRLLDTPLGHELYRQGQITIEPCSARSRSTARSNASNAAPDPPVAANGD
jgi:hypothetical protein